MTTRLALTKKDNAYKIRVTVQDELVDGTWQDRPSETVILTNTDDTTEKTLWKNRGRRLIIEEVD